MRSSRDFASTSADRLAHAILHGRRAAVTEAALELLRELAVVLPEDGRELVLERLVDRAGLLGELVLEVAGRLLELRLHELGVRARLLAVEHARADLDGVRDGPGRIVPVLLALADEPDGALVLHDEAVDRDPVAHHAHVRLPEWSCSFHLD